MAKHFLFDRRGSVCPKGSATDPSAALGLFREHGPGSVRALQMPRSDLGDGGDRLCDGADHRVLEYGRPQAEEFSVAGGQPAEPARIDEYRAMVDKEG